MIFGKSFRLFNNFFNASKPFFEVLEIDSNLHIISGQRKIVLSNKHRVYMNDIINSFDYYYLSVQPVLINDYLTVDFSRPSYHEVLGYNLMPVHFQSLSEPLSSTDLYVDFARLQPGQCVVDLGAYSGLTSMIFSELVGPEGSVIAVEADEKNIRSIQKNISLYKKLRFDNISVFEGAIWSDSNGITFSSEGNMGSSAALYLNGRGDTRHVKSITFSELQDFYKIPQVDFIKCDVEGAEVNIFGDNAFFCKCRPKILIETHIVNGVDTTASCVEALTKYGYKFNLIEQPGLSYPLLACSPS